MLCLPTSSLASFPPYLTPPASSSPYSSTSYFPSSSYFSLDLPLSSSDLSHCFFCTTTGCTSLPSSTDAFSENP